MHEAELGVLLAATPGARKCCLILHSTWLCVLMDLALCVLRRAQSWNTTRWAAAGATSVLCALLRTGGSGLPNLMNCSPCSPYPAAYTYAEDAGSMERSFYFGFGKGTLASLVPWPRRPALMPSATAVR